MAVLKVQGKKATVPEEFELNLDRITMGRAPDNVLVLDDKAASRHHAEIRRSGGGWILADLGSSNGTWVDGGKIGTLELSNGVVFLIGNTRLSFVEESWDGRTMQVNMEEIAEDEVKESAPAVEAPAYGTPGPPPVGPAYGSPAPPASAPIAPVVPPPVMPPAVAVPQQVQARPQPMPPSFQAAAAPAMPPAGIARAHETRELAGFGIRLGAYLLDGLILGVLMIVVMIPLGLLIAVIARKAPDLMIPLTVLSYLIVILLSFAYILVPWAKSGATPGKKILHLKIVRDDGIERLGYGKAFLRLLGYFVNGITLYIGFLMILFNPEKKGLHDMIAGTRVIRV